MQPLLHMCLVCANNGVNGESDVWVWIRYSLIKNGPNEMPFG